jgi:hypothetical protein
MFINIFGGFSVGDVFVPLRILWRLSNSHRQALINHESNEIYLLKMKVLLVQWLAELWKLPE